METVNNMPGLAALIAIALALPASADEYNAYRTQEQAGVQPVAAKTSKSSRTIEAAQNKEGQSVQLNAPESNPDNMPYLTYAGAGSTSPCNDE
jgi:hypothetical protein